MNLEERYNAAAAGTNAGNAKVIGTTNSPVTNFFDGVGRGEGNNAPDEYQEQFTANNPGDFRYGGGGRVAGKYVESTWKNVATGKFTTLSANNAFTSIVGGDVRNAPNTVVHKFTPEAKFQESDTLSPFAKSKAL